MKPGEAFSADTVAAVSTPRGVGGVAMIRISGSKVSEILDRCFIPFGKNKPSEHPRTAVYGRLVSGNGTTADNVIVTYYASPASYTGEDTAEICCHGGLAVTASVLEAVLEAGASPAGAGEFTRRAFINGKLSLSEAQAVGELISADTEEKRRLALSASDGRLSNCLSEIYSILLDVLSAIWAVIDYPEEELTSESEGEITAKLNMLADKADSLSVTYKTGRAISIGIKTTICGAPNSGKSSLYNLIVGEDRAIVTDVMGTTRDILEETVSFGGITLRIADTAGIREGTDEVEKIGVTRARKKILDSELVFLVIDTSRELNDYERELISEISQVNEKSLSAVTILNKSDLIPHISDADLTFIKAKLGDRNVLVSAKTGDGINELARAVSDLYNSTALSLESDAIIWNAEQHVSITKAAQLLREASSAIAAGEPYDCVSLLMEQALAEIGRIDGKGVSEEIVNSIFSKFCVGK